MKTILGELEQKIMDILWASEVELKPADVNHKLGDKFAYTTVMTVLKRLTDKGLLNRRLEGKVYFYKSSKPKSAFAKSRLADLFKVVVNSYGELAISQFIDSVKDNPEDLKALKEYLKNYSEE